MRPWNKGLTYRMVDRLAIQGGHFVGEQVGPGRLTEYLGKNKHGHHLWGWQCSCGEIRKPSTYGKISRGKGCAKCVKPTWKGYREISGTYLSQIKDCAKRRGLEFEITPEYLWEVWQKQEGRCVYSGVQLTHDYDASLDRKNNDKGYVRGNVQWVHKDVNRMKTDFSHEHFIKLCQQIAETALISDFVRE